MNPGMCRSARNLLIYVQVGSNIKLILSADMRLRTCVTKIVFVIRHVCCKKKGGWAGSTVVLLDEW